MAPHLDEALLDDPDELQGKDSRGTLRALATAGAQVREALHLGREAGIERLADQGRPRSVLVAAIGGSSIVAEVLELLAEPGSPVPVQARRNLPLPGWVGPMDLVVAVSLSGRAPGPLAVAAEAARRGIDLRTVSRWMSAATADLVGFPGKGRIAVGADADLLVHDLAEDTVVVAGRLAHRNPISAYDWLTFPGRVTTTLVRGRVVDAGRPDRTWGRQLERTA